MLGTSLSDSEAIFAELMKLFKLANVYICAVLSYSLK